MSELIRFSDVALGYQEEPVLSGVRFSVATGDFVGIVGPNGSGKTTLLRTVIGILDPLSGEVNVDRSRRFAYVPQVEELNLLWPITVREMVELPSRSTRAFGRLTPDDERGIESALDNTGITALADRPYAELSGGQRQRTALAQALSRNPDVILLDEPTRGLDVKVEREFLTLLGELNAARRLTILFVTHSLAIPLNETKKILIIHEGRVVETTPTELATTDRLERIYGMPFEHGTSGGQAWAAPKRTP